MFGLFNKRKDFTKTIISTSKQVNQREIAEEEFLKKANTCPECNYEDNSSWIRYEGNGDRYSVPVKCKKCKCEFEYERPYSF